MKAEVRQIAADSPLVARIISEHFSAEDTKAWKEHLRRSELWAGFINGDLVAIWGLIPSNLLSEKAYLWSWVAPGLRAKKTFLQGSREIVAWMLTRYPTLYGYCLGPTVWLRHLGAEINGNQFWIRA